MSEKTRCGRYCQFPLEAEYVEKVAEMFKGTPFNEAMLVVALLGIDTAYTEHMKEKEGFVEKKEGCCPVCGKQGIKHGSKGTATTQDNECWEMTCNCKDQDFLKNND